MQRKDRSDLRTIHELQTRCGDLANQNRLLKFELERMRDEYAMMDRNNIESIRTHEERMKNNEFQLSELEKQHKTNIDRLINENNYRVKEIVRDWEQRCRALEDRSRLLDLETHDLEQELTKISERSADLAIRQGEEVRELARRIEEEEF